MTNTTRSVMLIRLARLVPMIATLTATFGSSPVFAQSPELKEKVAELKAKSAQNKQALMAYTWQEQDTISIKGEVKKQNVFQVRLGPDGQPQKTDLNPQQPQQAQQPSGRRGRVKEKVVEKKKAEFEDYADQIKQLAHGYASLDPQKLQSALQAGNISLTPGGAPGVAQIALKSLLKPNDSVTLLVAKGTGVQSIKIASYLSDPTDAVTISILYAPLPGGPNHISTMSIDGASKQLNVAVQNSNYQKM